MEIVAQPQSSTQATSETKDILHNHSDTETPELTNEDMAEKGINHKLNLDYSYTVICVLIILLELNFLFTYFRK